MNVDDGKWNEQKYWDYIALLENPEWKAEAQVIGENCNDSRLLTLKIHRFQLLIMQF